MPDLKSFEQFMRDYQDFVYSTAVRILGNPTEAQDVCQEVFLRAFDHFEKLQTTPGAGGWLKTVATRLCLNHLSRYRARWTFFSETGGDDPESSHEFAENVLLPPTLPSTGNELSEVIDPILARLSDAHRVPLVLFYFEGRSYEEISRMLGISLAQTKINIHRAKRRMREMLERSTRGSGLPSALRNRPELEMKWSLFVDALRPSAERFIQGGAL